MLPGKITKPRKWFLGYFELRLTNTRMQTICLLLYEFLCISEKSSQTSISVVPNRGAVKRCQGCRQILNLLPFKFFTTKGGQIGIKPGKGAAQYFSVYRVPWTKKVEKHCSMQWQNWVHCCLVVVIQET
jgi:hypothetical protein